MKTKKYILTEETKMVYGHAVYHIRFLVDIPRHKIRAGTLGGWIESDENLSQDGDCAVREHAVVYGNAQIADHAIVYGMATVSGNARVGGNATVCDQAHIDDNAVIADSALVDCNALIIDNATVQGNAHVTGRTILADHARVAGNAVVMDTIVEDNAYITDKAIVTVAHLAGNAEICGTANVLPRSFFTNHALVKSPADYIVVAIGRNFITAYRCKDGSVEITDGKKTIAKEDVIFMKDEFNQQGIKRVIQYMEEISLSR